MTSDATGNVIDRFSFDAWGKRRDVTWAAFFPTAPASLWQNQTVTRGFTGHEQLDPIGLVHMNGRVYDPELGRFLSADAFIEDPSDLQSLNVYSYVHTITRCPLPIGLTAHFRAARLQGLEKGNERLALGLRQTRTSVARGPRLASMPKTASSRVRALPS